MHVVEYIARKKFKLYRKCHFEEEDEILNETLNDSLPDQVRLDQNNRISFEQRFDNKIFKSCRTRIYINNVDNDYDLLFLIVIYKS